MKVRAIAVAALLCLATFVVAQQLGTKPDLSTVKAESTPIVDGAQMIQMLVALTVVFVLVKYGLPKVMGRAGNRFTTSENAAITVRETVTCGSSTLQVVEVRGRTLLIGVSPQSVSFLTELDTPTKDDKPAFFELIDSKLSPVVESAPEPTPVAKAVVSPVSEPATNPMTDEAYEESLQMLLSARRKLENRQGVEPEEPSSQPQSTNDRLKRLIG